MTVTGIQLPVINHAIQEVCFALEERSHLPPSWTNMPEDALWRELVACILGSRVRFEAAYAAVERMERRRLFCEHGRSSRLPQYEQDVMGALSERCAPDEPNPIHSFGFGPIKYAEQPNGFIEAEARFARFWRTRMTLEMRVAG